MKQLTKEAKVSTSTIRKKIVQPTKIRAGWYEYRDHTILKDNKVNTRRSGPVVEWVIYTGTGIDRTFAYKAAIRKAAIEWIDRQGEPFAER